MKTKAKNEPETGSLLLHHLPSNSGSDTHHPSTFFEDTC